MTLGWGVAATYTFGPAKSLWLMQRELHLLQTCPRPLGPYMGPLCVRCPAGSASQLSATPHQPRVERMRDRAGLRAAYAGCAAIVGRLGLVPLGAVGLSNLVHFFATVFFSFLLVVTTPRVADALAVSDTPKARQGFCEVFACHSAQQEGLMRN